MLFSPTAQRIQKLLPRSCYMCCFYQPFKVYHFVFTNSTKYPTALTQKLFFHVLFLSALHVKVSHVVFTNRTKNPEARIQKLFLSALQRLPRCFHQQHKVCRSPYPEAVVPCAVSLSPLKSTMLKSPTLFSPTAQSIQELLPRSCSMCCSKASASSLLLLWHITFISWHAVGSAFSMPRSCRSKPGSDWKKLSNNACLRAETETSGMSAKMKLQQFKSGRRKMLIWETILSLGEGCHLGLEDYFWQDLFKSRTYQHEKLKY